MDRARFITCILFASSLLAYCTDAGADDPYSHLFAVNPGGVLDFTVEQYSGNSTDPAYFIDDWSGSSGVSGSLSAALWRKPDGTYSHMQMNDVNLSADSTIGYSDWFNMTTNWGQTRMRARVRELNIQDAAVPGNSGIATDGSFLLQDYPSLMNGYLDVQLQYLYLIFWGPIPGIDDPITENY